MKAFQKLALVSAIAALPAAGFAMEALDDATMAGVTGQDGISIGLGLNATLNIGIEDLDGFGPDHTGSGLLLIEGVSIDNGAGGAANITVDIDSGTHATNGSALQLLITTGAIEIATGDIYVGAGQDTAALTNPGQPGGDRGTANAGLAALEAVSTAGNPLLSSSTIALNGATIGIQLGAGASNFLSLSGTIAGGLSISNFGVNDVTTGNGGSLTVDEILIGGYTVAGGIGDLDLTGTTASIRDGSSPAPDDQNGLVLSFGAGFSNLGIAQMGVKLGDDDPATPYLGNVYVTGLDLTTSTVTISGK